jgi:hypothetical protein
MTSIAKQNTIDALTIYHKAHVNKWEVRVSESGNVRIATWTDRFKSGFRAIFNPSRERTKWDEKAKLAIQHKLQLISFGRTALEIKSTVGAYPVDYRAFIRFENKIVNSLLYHVLPEKSGGDWIQRNPFK